MNIAASPAQVELTPSVVSPVVVASPDDRRQSAILALGRRAIISPDIAILLQDAAGLSAETLDADFSAISEVLPGEAALLVRVAAGANPGKQHRCSQAADKSLGAFALSVSRPVLVDELGDEQRFTDAFLAGERIRSAIAIPLKLADQAFGVLLVGSTQAKKFAAHDVLFLETISHLVTTTIARQKAEQALAQDRRFLESVLSTIDALVLTIDLDGNILGVNTAFTRVSGFSATEVQGRTLWNAICLPEELRIVQNALDKLRSQRTNLEFESYLLTRLGQRRRIAWSWTVQAQSGERPATVLCTGIDITEREVAHLEIERLQRIVKTSLELSATQKEAEDSTTAADEMQAFGIMPEQQGSERRGKPRRAYPYIQLIAPMVDGQLPPRSAFREVRCRDIAAGGFSFLTPRLPPEEFFVVALGSGAALTYLIAQAMHSTQVIRDGRVMYLVGCNYTGRAAY